MKEKITPAIEKILQDIPPNEARIFPLLREGEKLKRVAAIHWGIYWQGVAVMIIALLVMIKAFNLGVFLLVVSVFMLSYTYLVKYYLLMALTDKRVLVRHGIFNLDVVQLHYNRIESVEVFRPVMGRLLGYGTVLVTGTGSRVTGVPYIANADSIRSEIDRIVFDREEKQVQPTG